METEVCDHKQGKNWKKVSAIKAENVKNQEVTNNINIEWFSWKQVTVGLGVCDEANKWETKKLSFQEIWIRKEKPFFLPSSDFFKLMPVGQEEGNKYK